MIDTTVRLTGHGYTVVLSDSAEELHRQPGGGGWGMVPVINSWFEGAGDGAILRGTRRTQRELQIPIAAFGNNRAEVETNLRALTRIIHDPFIVHVDYADNKSFWIEAAYDSGLEGVYTIAPELWAEATINLKCPDPYWTSDATQSFVVAPAPALAPFLPELAGLYVASAAAFGTVSITNTGDIESYPTWEVHGPGSNLIVSVNGQGFQLNKTLTDTDVVTVKFIDGGWTITDQTGANLYADLADTPLFPTLPPGGSIATVSMDDSGTGTFILATYPERREVVY